MGHKDAVWAGVRHLDARLLWLQQLSADGVVEVRARPGEHNEADLGTKMVHLRRMTLAFERNTHSAANGLELMDGDDDSPRGCRGSNRLLCIDLEREEHVRGRVAGSGSVWEWSIVILTVLSSGPIANPISDDCRRQKETDETAAWRRPMKNELRHHEKVFRSGLCVEPCCEWLWIAGMRSARIVWTAARSILCV